MRRDPADKRALDLGGRRRGHAFYTVGAVDVFGPHRDQGVARRAPARKSLSSKVFPLISAHQARPISGPTDQVSSAPPTNLGGIGTLELLARRAVSAERRQLAVRG